MGVHALCRHIHMLSDSKLPHLLHSVSEAMPIGGGAHSCYIQMHCYRRLLRNLSACRPARMAPQPFVGAPVD